MQPLSIIMLQRACLQHSYVGYYPRMHYFFGIRIHFHFLYAQLIHTVTPNIMLRRFIRKS